MYFAYLATKISSPHNGKEIFDNKTADKSLCFAITEDALLQLIALRNALAFAVSVCQPIVAAEASERKFTIGTNLR